MEDGPRKSSEDAQQDAPYEFDKDMSRSQEKTPKKTPSSLENIFAKTIDSVFENDKKNLTSEEQYSGELYIDHQESMPETAEENLNFEGKHEILEQDFDKRHEAKEGEVNHVSDDLSEEVSEGPTPISKILSQRIDLPGASLDEVNSSKGVDQLEELSHGDSMQASSYKQAIMTGFIGGLALIIIVLTLLILTRLF